MNIQLIPLLRWSLQQLVSEVAELPCSAVPAGEKSIEGDGDVMN